MPASPGALGVQNAVEPSCRRGNWGFHRDFRRFRGIGSGCRDRGRTHPVASTHSDAKTTRIDFGAIATRLLRVRRCVRVRLIGCVSRFVRESAWRKTDRTFNTREPPIHSLT